LLRKVYPDYESGEESPKSPLEGKSAEWLQDLSRQLHEAIAKAESDQLIDLKDELMQALDRTRGELELLKLYGE
jgi:hypothetical protein